MKPAPKSLPLFLSLLLSIVLPCRMAQADITLVYGEVAEGESPDAKAEVISAQRIYLREGALALETFGEPRVVLFDQEAGSVRVIEHDKKVYIDLDEVMVSKMAENLSTTQRKVLDGLEEKVSKMKKEDRKKIRKVLDELHAATETQLGTVIKARYEKSETPVTIGEFETTVVDAYLNKNHSARYFLVDHDKLDMTKGEYDTLIEFQEFVRRLSELTPGALRKNFGDFGMLARSGQVPVQVTRFKPLEAPSTQQLLKHFNREIESEWFEIPEEYVEVTLRPQPISPGKGG